MTSKSSPITPPPELIKRWEDQHFDEGENYDVMLIQAFQAGADQELEACCEWTQGYAECGDSLRAARRPKPPSLKEQALEKLMNLEQGTNPPSFNDYNTIRRALEALPE